MRYQLIAFDMDGTLLDSKKFFPPVSQRFQTQQTPEKP